MSVTQLMHDRTNELTVQLPRILVMDSSAMVSNDYTTAGTKTIMTKLRSGPIKTADQNSL